ncbi:MAG TPA: hypothetical protein VGN20_13980 [Mucilaginibacter sp.]|jgi:hypothetical protein
MKLLSSTRGLIMPALFISFTILCISSSAQVTPKPEQKDEMLPNKIPFVIKVRARQIEVDRAKQSASAGDIILLQVTNPKEFIKQRLPEKAKIVLYAGGVELKGITSDLFNGVRKEDFDTRDTTMWIPFTLKKDSTTKVAWDFLYKLADKWDQNEIKVNFSLAWEGNLPLRVSPKDLKETEITIVYYDKLGFYAIIVVYLVLLVGLGFLVVETDILKEGKKGAYSLAQTQLAFWTILILGGFIYSLALTEIPSTLNSSVLMLLGISIGTNGISNYIDYFKKIRPGGGAFKPKKPSGFWRDILGDGISINMQRFQIVAWNVVLGAYYTVYTVHNKTMPIIPDVLLTLAGLSSLTYVAAKPTET